MAYIAVILEGGLVRGVYINGREAPNYEVFDFDVEGSPENEAALDEQIDGVLPSELRDALYSYR